ncbi:hypothetical protein F2Q68_00043949 [Brassica cretica]|uniref:No apical meristem-associated C-terminal domain-containing protein n=1 Tax=Brassica cretica TaxID=69181 RepID=A0A8S9LG30_BRACR|nr:hypothetical protein F2Q68_00043949 [Brassica cretica]
MFSSRSVHASTVKFTNLVVIERAAREREVRDKAMVRLCSMVAIVFNGSRYINAAARNGSNFIKVDQTSSKHLCFIFFSQSSAQSSTFVAGEDKAMARPVGVKAAKAKGRSKATASGDEVKPLVEFQSMWEIRQKEFALKEQLNKQKLLDSLIAKTEPLSELEIALKNKLITDMLSS